MILITKFKAADVEFVKSLEIEAGLGSWTKQDYLSEISRADSLFFVAKERRKPLGFLLARLIMNKIDDESLKNEIEIYNLAVKNEYRGRNVGAQLLKKIIQVGEARRVEKIKLEVRKSNILALNFYKKNLFEIDGERKKFYSNPTEDAVLMTRIIHCRKTT